MKETPEFPEIKVLSISKKQMVFIGLRGRSVSILEPGGVPLLWKREKFQGKIRF